MPQVLRPNEYTHQRKKRATEFGIFELNKQVVVLTLTGIILSAWLIACYLNNGLFFKEAAICSCIIFFLIFIKSKTVKKS
jgi:hypothetical protein